jgi:prepilin-type processing-associated H-X9-DG protein
MSAFYRHCLVDQQTPSHALRQAQQWLRDTTFAEKVADNRVGHGEGDLHGLMERFDDVRAADHLILRAGRSPANMAFLDGRVAVRSPTARGRPRGHVPGHDTLLGVLPVSRVLASSAIERVQLLGGAAPTRTRSSTRVTSPVHSGLWVG